jgi:hypothetical protein
MTWITAQTPRVQCGITRHVNGTPRVYCAFPIPSSSHLPRRRCPHRKRTRRPNAQRQSIWVRVTEKDVFERKSRTSRLQPTDQNLWHRNTLSFAILRPFSCLAPQTSRLNEPTDGALHNRDNPKCRHEAELPELPRLFVLETLSTDTTIRNPHPQPT